MFKYKSLLASAARTATPTDATLTIAAKESGSGMAHIEVVHIIVDVTAVTATPSVVFTIENYNQATNSYYPVLSATAITATGTTVLKVGLGITPSAGSAANDMVTNQFRVVPTHGDGDSITYSIGANIVYTS